MARRAPDHEHQRTFARELTMGSRVRPGALAGATGAESNIADRYRRCHIRPAASAQDPRPYKPRSAQPAIVAADWRSVERNTLKGFFTLLLPSGLVLRDCSLHELGRMSGSAFPADRRSTSTAVTASTRPPASGSISRSSRSRTLRPVDVEAMDLQSEPASEKQLICHIDTAVSKSRTELTVGCRHD